MAHALQVREAVCMDDYAAFFKLYGAAPGMGRALLDMFVSVVRWRALNALVRVFKPSLGADFLARLLGFVARSSTAGNQSDAKAELQGEAAALEVLPGCSAAVFPGKYPAAVRLLSQLLPSVAKFQCASASYNSCSSGLSGELRFLICCPFGLQDDEVTGLHLCVQWLQAHGAVITMPKDGESTH